MNLEQALQQVCFEGLSDAAALALGNTLVNFPIDPTAYTWSGLGKQLAIAGIDLATLGQLPVLVAGLQGGPMFSACLSSGGFDFSDPYNRAALTAELSIAGITTQVTTLINAMLAIGEPTGTNWQLWGVSPAPQLSDITAARASNATNQAAITAFMNATLNPLIGSGSASPAAIKTAVDTWVGSLS